MVDIVAVLTKNEFLFVIVGGVFQKPTDAVAAGELFSPEQLVEELGARGVALTAGRVLRSRA